MKLGIWRTGLCASLLCTALISGPVVAENEIVNSLIETVREGEVILNVRYRYEMVDQASFARDAHANTVRTRFGYQTAEWHQFRVLAEGEHVGHIGDDQFNDTVNGRVMFPVVADPDVLELNRLHITYSGLPDTQIKAGRQRIIFDNARFFGNVGFRQNEQTFDGVVVANSSIPMVDIAYGYVLQVNRVFGDDSPAGDFNTSVHVVRAGTSAIPFGYLQTYAYLAKVDDVPTLSSETYGVRFSGGQDIGQTGVRLLYTGEFAHQSEYRNNPMTFDHHYFHAEGGFAFRGLTAKGGWESLDGDGTSALQTPLATLHAFQGWADQFLTTPVGGIEDIYGSISYVVPPIPNLGFVDKITLTGVYHDFQAEQGGADYGSEIDAQVAVKLFDRFSMAVRYANYQSDGFLADAEKVWLTVGMDL